MKLNKTLMIATLAVGSLFASGLPSQAQDNTNTPPANTPPPGGMRQRPNFDTIAKQLELTDDQKPKVKAVFDEMQQKQKDLRADTSVAQADKRAKAKEIRDAATAKLKDILTADQFAKWEKMGPGQRQRPPQAAPQQ
jgi:Spy/CpxP family protein refolding chaperone